MRKLFIFLLSLLMCAFAIVNVNAVTEPIDFEKTGSLSVTMKCSHGYISGGNVALYRIAELKWIDENYKFEYTRDFKDCHIPLNNLNADGLADSFNNYIIEKQIVVNRNILEDGTIVYNNLPLGLYLVVHEEATDGFTNALPFIVTLPMSNGAEWEYNVDATPKVEIKHSVIVGPPDIPQTGQLKWPVPVMAALGVIIFAIGLVLCFKRGNKE